MPRVGKPASRSRCRVTVCTPSVFAGLVVQAGTVEAGPTGQGCRGIPYAVVTSRRARPPAQRFGQHNGWIEKTASNTHHALLRASLRCTVRSSLAGARTLSGSWILGSWEQGFKGRVCTSALPYNYVACACLVCFSEDFCWAIAARA